MGRRYYCDYCDKTFPDNPLNRKNHLRGVAHQANRQAYNYHIQTPEIILNMEKEKKPCHAFTSKGCCPFGDACKYSHMTTERKKQLEYEVQNQVTKYGKLPVKRTESEIKVYIDRMESLIKQREIFKRKTASNMKDLNVTILEPHNDCIYPQCVKDLNVDSITPSLLIPNPIELSTNIEWG